MDKLVAISPILFEAHLYKIGEELPASNHEMVKLWLDNGMAQWKNEAKEKTESNIQTIGDSVEIADENKEISDDNPDNDNKIEPPSDENLDVDNKNIKNQNEKSESNKKSNEKSEKPIGRRNR